MFQLTIHKKADFEGGRKVDYLIFVLTHSPARGLTGTAYDQLFIHINPDDYPTFSYITIENKQGENARPIHTYRERKKRKLLACAFSNKN